MTVTYSDDTPDVTYTYDQNGFTGFLTTVDVDGVTNSTFEYDQFGNLTEENVALDGVSGTFTSAYTYDLGGRLLTVTYPSGRVVTQSYIASNGITNDLTDEVEDATKGASLLSAVQANAAGAITARTLSTGIAETRTFNQRNQLTRIAAAAGGATFMDMGYGYGTSNNNGKIRSRTDAVQPEHSASYTFDEIGRLTEVSGMAASWGISWTLDRYGNRTAQTPTGLASGLGSPNSFYGNPNTTNRDAAFTYDNAGNLTDDGPNTYYYDAESRLYQINSSQVQYAYDYAGRRIKRTVGSDTTYYFYGLTGLMSEFSTASGASGAAASDRLQYRVGEQTGTAVMLVDASGTPRENNRVFPFGEPWVAFAGSNNAEKFTTYQHDNDDGTDLDYAMARYYASRSGRFMTPDPGHVGANLGDPQSWNAYAYALNDPINFIDPDGLCIFEANGKTVFAPDGGDGCPNGTSVTVTGTGMTAAEELEFFRPLLELQLFRLRNQERPSVSAPPTKERVSERGSPIGIRAPGQTFMQCMEVNAGTYSLFGIGDALTGGRLSSNDVTNFAGNVIGGNIITGTVFAFWGESQGFNAVTTAPGWGATLAAKTAGRPITYGRRTSDIISLNIPPRGGRAPGGLPQALSSSSQGAKSLLGKLAVSMNLKLAADAILTAAEAIGCSMER